MPFTKTFGATSGSYATETLWLKNSVRTPAFAWTQSGSGTNEYYVRTAANGDPGFVASPTTNLVFLNSIAAAKATLGSLTAGQFGYGDNDTLGYSTLYVRLADGADPDSKALDWVQFQQSPQTGEHVRFTPSSGSVNAGLDQSAVAIGDFIVEKGYRGALGSAALGYLSIDPNRFEFSGDSECWIDLTTAAIDARIHGTFGPADGERGLYLKGTAIAVLDVMGGSVGLAVRPGETSTATTARVMGTGTSLWTGNGLTLTNLHQYAGETRIRGGVTTKVLYGGRMITEENGDMATVTQHGGEYHYRSSGDITSDYHLYGGKLDLQQSGATRTIAALHKYRGSWTILRNKEAVTITAETPEASYSESGSAA